ncbi:uncharacterized protein LOC142327419 [Lycorma delicatula]|uniref:uncharacterized protein LOC142327419 n=1 Tax=Lycorma delicatula TaxID=130591 RepID=UPI003F50E260
MILLELIFFCAVQCGFCLNKENFKLTGTENLNNLTNLMRTKNDNETKNDVCEDIYSEEKNNETFFQEDCSVAKYNHQINEKYKNVLLEFENSFDLLEKTTTFSHVFKKTEKMDAILLVGNTGKVFKQLFQIISNENVTINYVSSIDKNEKELKDESRFLNRDVTKKSNNLHPKILLLNDKNHTFIYNSEILETRQPVNELISLYFMKKLLSKIKRVKIVIVTSNDMLRNKKKFEDILKYLIKFIRNIKKYKDSFHLISLQTENPTSVNKSTITATDAIKSTEVFLNEIKWNVQKECNSILCRSKRMYKKTITIIDSLIKGNYENKFSLIKILDNFESDKSLENTYLIQKNLRNQLFTNDNSIEFKEEDFILTPTEDGKIFAENFFKSINLYIKDLSKIISLYIVNNFEKMIESNMIIDDVLAKLLHLKTTVKLLSIEIGNSKRPKNYFKIISEFLEKNKLKITCLVDFHIFRLQDTIIRSEDIPLKNISRYESLQWNSSLNIAIETVENKINSYKLLNGLFKILSNYDYQKNKTSSWTTQSKDQELQTDKNNFINLIKNNKFNMDYNHVKIDNELINKFNSIVNTSLNHELNVFCSNNTLTIVNYYVLLSELEDNIYYRCNNVSIIKIFAMHTIFIDKDMIGDFFKGKDLVIIAPIWNVVSNRIINISGISINDKLSKANFSEIGINGHNGGSGGNFLGVGMDFNNGEHLLVTANGGDGQNGQDGGDGLNGTDGIDGYFPKEEVSNQIRNLFLSYSRKLVYLSRGQPGEKGSNSGSGGKGGFGGNKGSVKIYGMKNQNHGFSVENTVGKHGESGEDGIPGKGGKNGCDVLVEKKENTLFLVQVDSSDSEYKVNCDNKSSDGVVIRPNSTDLFSGRESIYNGNSSQKSVILICEHIINFEKYYKQLFHSYLTDSTTEIFINFIKTKNYTFIQKYLR